MDGRSLPVLAGLTGQPPKFYQIPVPQPEGGPPVVHVYRREPANLSRRLKLPRGWLYVYEPEGKPHRVKWPWSRGH